MGGVSELADEHDLGSCAERRGGSSPPFPTFLYLFILKEFFDFRCGFCHNWKQNARLVVVLSSGAIEFKKLVEIKVVAS